MAFPLSFELDFKFVFLYLQKGLSYKNEVLRLNYRIFRWLITGSIVSLLFTVVLSLTMLFSGNFGDDEKNREITLELKHIVQQIADNQSKLIADSHQVSKLLNIPAEQYRQLNSSSFLQEQPDSQGPKKLVHTNNMTNEIVVEPLEKAGNSLEIAFFDALRYLDQNLQQEKIWKELNELLGSKDWKNLLKEIRLRQERNHDSVWLFPSKKKLLPSGHIASKWFELQAVQGKKAVQFKLSSPFSSYTGGLDISKELRLFLREQSTQLYSLATQYDKMYQFISSPTVQKQLARRKLYIKSLQPSKIKKDATTGTRILNVAQTDWEVRTRYEQIVAHFHFDVDNYQLRWNDKIYQSVQLLQSDWKIFVENVDTRTEGQRREAKMRQYLLKMFSDSAFLLQMEQYGFKPAKMPPREDLYYEYYDLLGQKGQKMASFALQKQIGEAYLMDRDDVKIRAIKSFLTGASDLQSLFNEDDVASIAQNSSYSPNDEQVQQKIANTFNNKNTKQRDLEVILLIGTHYNIADVIMLISINKDTQTLTMISLPRDLYYNKSKINNIYSMYGIATFMKVLSEIADIAISKYISIDMYAFIEVVDLIGGINVYLKEDLIDPSYKIKQMGKWQTLVMRKGKQHLNGLGALRYSRSRHTSNDFERSERQQLILNQVLQKLSGELGNPKKLLPFLKMMQKYIKTNFSTTEALRYWLSYGKYKRNFGNTINTNNVLYYTWTNYLHLNSQELAKAKQDQNFSRGAFILLPKRNDWSLIPNYIMQLQNN